MSPRKRQGFTGLACSAQVPLAAQRGLVMRCGVFPRGEVLKLREAGDPWEAGRVKGNPRVLVSSKPTNYHSWNDESVQVGVVLGGKYKSCKKTIFLLVLVCCSWRCRGTGESVRESAQTDSFNERLRETKRGWW